MKTLFIEARKKLKLNKEKLRELESMLPGTIYIAYSIQFKKLAEQVKNQLIKSKNRKILGFSQVLGCSKIKTKAQAILLIGEARFHALNLALSGTEVFIFDNFSTNKISKQEIEKMQKREQGKLIRFLSAKQVGILVSTKSGQNNLKIAEKLKKELKKQGKNPYLFIADNISISELENFPDIQSWINTACPGIALDSPKIINHSDITRELKQKVIKI